jgi:hypothetical protein
MTAFTGIYRIQQIRRFFHKKSRIARLIHSYPQRDDKN